MGDRNPAGHLLSGGGGNDYLEGGEGPDYLQCGAGTDVAERLLFSSRIIQSEAVGACAPQACRGQ
ncbi:hypothetical protein ACXNSR_00420 [Streptomyces sp. NC-S4]